jgi:predicted Zn-dependent protease
VLRGAERIPWTTVGCPSRKARPAIGCYDRSPLAVTIILCMSELGAEAESAVERSADADLVRSVELRARTLLDVGDVREARAVVQEALEASGDHADLLWMLADIEFTAGDVVAGRSCLMEAVAVNGNDAAVIARWIGALRRGGKAGQD